MGLIKNYANTPQILPTYKLIGTADDDKTQNFPLSDIADFVHTAKYTSYVGSIKQNSTNAPSPTIMDNSIGNIVWTRISAGLYAGTLTGAFVSNNTWLMGKTIEISGNDIVFYRHDENSVRIKKINGLDGFDAMIEIRIYN